MTLADLVKNNVVTYEEALNVSSFPKELARELGLSTVGPATSRSGSRCSGRVVLNFRTTL